MLTGGGVDVRHDDTVGALVEALPENTSNLSGTSIKNQATTAVGIACVLGTQWLFMLKFDRKIIIHIPKHPAICVRGV